MTTDRPNIVVFLSDQQRPGTCGCYGQELDVTPVLDCMAAEGTVFDNCYSCQPVCGPARSSMQTGLYPTYLGTSINGQGLSTEEDTIAKALSRSGYETAYVGKWHLASDFSKGIILTKSPIPPERMGGYRDYIRVADALEMTSHGYDGYVYDRDGKRIDFKGYRTDCITDFAIEYLNNRNKERPFFLFISHIEPHQQNDRNCFEGPTGSKEKYKDYKVPSDLIDRKYPGDWKENYPDYLGQCNALDRNLGRVIESLKKNDLYDNTILIYSSDHGCHFRTMEGEYKRNSFEASIHVPLVITGGPFTGRGRVESMVSNIELAPTIVALTGSCMEENPFRVRTTFIDALEKDQEAVFFQISETECARGVRTHRWKYVVNAPHIQPVLPLTQGVSHKNYRELLTMARTDSNSYVEEYLFDLDNDIDERINLIDNAELDNVKDELRKILIDRMKMAGEKEPVIYPAWTILEKTYREEP